MCFSLNCNVFLTKAIRAGFLVTAYHSDIPMYCTGKESYLMSLNKNFRESLLKFKVFPNL